MARRGPGAQGGHRPRDRVEAPGPGGVLTWRWPLVWRWSFDELEKLAEDRLGIIFERCQERDAAITQRERFAIDLAGKTAANEFMTTAVTELTNARDLAIAQADELRRRLDTMLVELTAARTESATWQASSNAWSEQARGLLEAIERRDERDHTLVADMLQMKREGFNPAAAAVTFAPPQPGPELPTEVQEVIDEMAGGNKRLKRQMEADAVKLLADEDTDIVEVIAHFRQGSVPDVVD